MVVLQNPIVLFIDTSSIGVVRTSSCRCCTCQRYGQYPQQFQNSSQSNPTVADRPVGHPSHDPIDICRVDHCTCQQCNEVHSYDVAILSCWCLPSTDGTSHCSMSPVAAFPSWCMVQFQHWNGTQHCSKSGCCFPVVAHGAIPTRGTYHCFTSRTNVCFIHGTSCPEVEHLHLCIGLFACANLHRMLLHWHCRIVRKMYRQQQNTV